MSRRIKDIKDRNTGLLVYPRTHLSAVVVDETTNLENLIGTNVGSRLNLLETTIKTDGSGEKYLSDNGTYQTLDLSGKLDIISDLEDIRSGAALGTTSVLPNSLSTVATSGSYGDLKDKPIQNQLYEATSEDGANFSITIPDVSSMDDLIGRIIVINPIVGSASASCKLQVNELDSVVIRRNDDLLSQEWWGFPTATWMAANVPIPVMYNGTYWKTMSMSKPYASDLNGTVSIEKGGTGSTTAAAALTALGGQPQLVSGTNIKTINGTSLLGSGDIAIASGGNIPISNETATTKAISPNVFYVWGTMSSLTITLTTPANSNIYNEYMFQFISGSTATTISLPSDVVILNNTTIEANKTYQVSIVKGLAVVCGFDIKAQGCCFVAGTQVTMSDGTTKNIEDIKEGESVLSYNVETNENYETIVKNLIVNPCAINMARVTLEDGTSVTMNEYHPIYTTQGWKSLTNYHGYPTLTESDSLFKEDLSYVKISSIERWAESNPVITYHLDVMDNDEVIDIDDNDNFFVNGICAHNALVGHY